MPSSLGSQIERVTSQSQRQGVSRQPARSDLHDPSTEATLRGRCRVTWPTARGRNQGYAPRGRAWLRAPEGAGEDRPSEVGVPIPATGLPSTPAKYAGQAWPEIASRPNDTTRYPRFSGPWSPRGLSPLGNVLAAVPISSPLPRFNDRLRHASPSPTVPAQHPNSSLNAANHVPAGRKRSVPLTSQQPC